MCKEFDVEGWKYPATRLDIERFAAQLNPKAYATMLLETLNIGGGKAFGLNIADRIALKNPSLFNVPEWLIIPFGEDGSVLERFLKMLTVNFVNQQRFMVRSSALHEDWMSPLSGEHESKIAFGQPELLRFTREVIATSGAAVVQDYVVGVGIVVDIGYSKLLKKTVVRVASGRPTNVGGRTVYTSATWDNEAQVSVYDTNGEMLVPFHEMGMDDVRAKLPELVRELVKAVKDIGIDFGVQLELIINPNMIKHGAKWNIVQIRPSPGTLRGAGGVLLQSKGKLICTTGKVSKASVAEANLVKDPAENFSSQKPWIALWVNDLSKYNCLFQIDNANAHGACGHLSDFTLITNSAHGTSLNLPREDLEIVLQGSLMMIIPRKAFFLLRSKLRKEDSVRVCMLSDGLIGQLYLLSNEDTE